MTAHRANDLFIVFGINPAAGLFAQKKRHHDLVPNYQRDKQLDALALKAPVIHLEKRQDLRLRYIEGMQAVGQKLPLVLIAEGQAGGKILAEAPQRDHIHLVAVTRIACYPAAHNA